jgi:hypothetical protein
MWLTSPAGGEAGIKRHAAVDEKRSAGHIIGRLRRQPNGGLSDIVRLANSLVRHQSHEIRVGRGRVQALWPRPGQCRNSLP